MRTVLGERIGILDEVINFEQYVESSRDSTGQSVGNWTVYEENTFARIDFRIRGSEEIILMDQVTPQRTALFTIHYRTDITEKMRIKHNGKIYNIDSILPHEGRDFLTIEAIAAER